jgi:hypothetical protein
VLTTSGEFLQETIKLKKQNKNTADRTPPFPEKWEKTFFIFKWLYWVVTMILEGKDIFKSLIN